MNQMKTVGLLLTAAGLFLFLPLRAQEGSGDPAQTSAQIADWKKTAPRIFMDFNNGDMDYIRKEIPFVNYVRDRKEADVHILVTTQSTGSGGIEYAMAFIGQGAYEGLSSNLIYASNTTDTDDEVRKGYVAVLKMGLIPYVAKTSIRDLLTIECREPVQPTDVEDPWKFWVFSLSVGGEFDSESRQKSQELSFSVTANKITPEWKLRLGMMTFFNRDEFSYEDDLIESDSKMFNFVGLLAKSLGDHWSVGFSIAANSSTFSNVNFSVAPAPMIEYNLFPYAESTRRQLRFMYKIGLESVRYREETIYDKMKETLFGQALSATLEIKEPWGSLYASLEGSHYFHDVKKNRLNFFTEFSFRILKGLEFNVNARYERVRDQLSLPKGNATLEEILLERKELATEYEFGIDLSLSFTFGSVFSNVVNPRFGSLGSLHNHYY